MYHTNELKHQIEQLRKHMYRTFENNPDDPEVLSISQRLDSLLNEYDKILGKMNTSG